MRRATAWIVLLNTVCLLCCHGARTVDSKDQVPGERQTIPDDNKDSCPLTTSAQWQAFLDDHAHYQQWVTTCEDSPCDRSFFDFANRAVSQVLTRCSASIERSPRLAACTKNYRSFVPAWLRQHDASSYGFAVDNLTHFAMAQAPQMPPGMMNPPDELVAAIPDLEKIQEAAQKNGWPYIIQDSALGGVHTFIVVSDPAGRFDQWFILGLDRRPRQLTMMTVQKADADGRLLGKIRLNFRELDIIKGAASAATAIPQEHGDGKCYSCHPSGPRLLLERHTPTLAGKPVKGDKYSLTGSGAPEDFAFRRLLTLNERMRDYDLPDWGGLVDPDAFGPMLGKDQGCTSCHDGKARGILTVATSVNQLEQKVVAQLAMPPEQSARRLLEGSALSNPPLTPSEQQRLQELQDNHAKILTDFLDSRLPALRAWLTEVPCEAN